MRHLDIAILQVRHPTLIKRGAAVAAIGLLFLLALIFTQWSLNDRSAVGLVGLWGISSEIVGPDRADLALSQQPSPDVLVAIAKNMSKAHALALAKSREPVQTAAPVSPSNAVADRSRWPKNSHYAADFKDVQWMISKDYVFRITPAVSKPAPVLALIPKKETPTSSLDSVPVKFILVELMEAEEQAAAEARVADPSFGKNYQRAVSDLKAQYLDGIRLRHDLTNEQLAAVYRLALEGNLRPPVLPKKAA